MIQNMNIFFIILKQFSILRVNVLNVAELFVYVDSFMDWYIIHFSGSYSAILASEISNGTATLPRNQYHQPLTSLTFPPGNSGSTVAVFGKEEEMVAIST